MLQSQVSGQLQAEALALAHSRVYTFGPTFRAEVRAEMSCRIVELLSLLDRDCALGVSSHELWASELQHDPPPSRVLDAGARASKCDHQ